ncbi:MAG TPA: GTPase HflX [Planctomycetota bacterium]|nr:GTPase HflX [Planctomycetota bacterium]
MRQPHKTVYLERALLAGIADGEAPARGESLEELGRLAETAGADVVLRVVQKRETPGAKYYIGSGKVEEIAAAVEREKIDVVIFENDLSPAQIRNLEKQIKRKVIDRTQLILDIFATHARSQQAKLQVELAQMEYSLPRLRWMWSHLGQQAGGAIGGAIGVRGPGEKQLEVDRRVARRRVYELKKEIELLEKRKRREVGVRTLDNYTVSLVGYTNAGKSTLMNALTGAGVVAEDRLFSTLDTRTRLWKLPDSSKVLLSDTVGFIRNLPTTLVSSFHATLEEVVQADLLLHVVDASDPDAERQIEAVEDVLGKIGAREKDTLILFNKVDRLRDAVEVTLLARRHPDSLAISARTGDGLPALSERISRILATRLVELEVEIPQSEGRLLADLAANAVILKREYGPERVRMRLRAPRRMLWKLRSFEADRTGTRG